MCMCDDTKQRLGDEGAGQVSDAARDAGTTLIEILVTIVLLGGMVGVIMDGMWTSIRVSRMSDDQAKVEAVLGSAADRLANYAYLPCPQLNDGYEPIIQSASGAVNWATSTVSVVNIEFWDPTMPGANKWQGANLACNDAAGLTTSKTLQRITIQVVSPQTGHTRQLQVVKNNVVPKDIPA